MSRRQRVGLLFGGVSVEHEVSLVSARGVAAALDPDRFETVPLAIAGDGRWLDPTESARILFSDAQRAEASTESARLVLDPGGGGLLKLARASEAQPVPIDTMFSVVHGWGGEDGRIQGLLELAGIPCVGAGVLGSAVGMDKQIAKALFEERGLPVGPWRSLLKRDWLREPAAREERLVAELGLPLFVKPANGGSSVGISKVRRTTDLPAALELAFAHDRKVVVESGLDAREIECAVLGNDNPEASILGEIVPAGEFYDYAAKYEDDRSTLRIPAPLPPALAESIRSLAIAAFDALDLSGMARVDFFVEKVSGRAVLNEVNTLPGFTPISMYPKLWEATGLSYRELLTRLIELAKERAALMSHRVSRRGGGVS